MKNTIQQADMFSGGAAHSVAPYLDPAKVAAVSVRLEIDRDRSDGGELVYVVEVHGHDGEILFADTRDTERAAKALANQLGGKVDGNRQQLMFL